MSFISVEYIVFFAIVIPLYFMTPFRWRWALLFIASCIFYMAWRAEYILVILLIALIDFYAARAIHRSTDPTRRKLLLFVSLFSNLSILFFFKYFNFFSDTVSSLLDVSAAHLNVILPLGISFHTFQSMAY